MNRERDFERFSTLIRMTAAAYGTELTPERVAIYFLDLSEFDIVDVEAALTARRKTHEFFPTVAALRELIIGSGTERAVKAWDRFLMAVRHHGAYESVDFGDPVLHTVVSAMGGWHEVAANLPADPEQLGYTRHTFCERYRSYAARALPGPAPVHLPGICEIQNGETRATWDHATGYRDPVLMISEDGRRASKRTALPAAPSTPALSSGESLSPERIRQTVQDLAEKLGPAPLLKPQALPGDIPRPPMEADPFMHLARPEESTHGQ